MTIFKDLKTNFRSWMITWNNYPDKDTILKTIKKKPYRWCKVCSEIGPECGTPHLHIALYLDNARCGINLLKQFPKGCEVKGKHKFTEALDRYISKPADHPHWDKIENLGLNPKDFPTDVWYEDGSKPSPGKRTDIAAARDLLKNGAGMRTIVNEIDSYQACRGAELWLKYCEPMYTGGARKVFWHYGATGCGKTWDAEHNPYCEYGEWFKPTTFKWWEGYDRHKVVILDDIRGDFCKFHEILMLTGESPFRVESKGGSRQAVYDVIYITSPNHPNQMWETIEDKSQLLDRISEIRFYDGPSKRESCKTIAQNVCTEVESNTISTLCKKKNMIKQRPKKRDVFEDMYLENAKFEIYENFESL